MKYLKTYENIIYNDKVYVIELIENGHEGFSMEDIIKL